MGALAPLAWLVHGTLTANLGPEPVDTIQRLTGKPALVLLFATLAVTPLRRITGLGELIRLRRLLGLFAFFYAVLHAASYFVFDQSLSVELIAEDVAEHPWVTVGFLALMTMVPLAATSSAGMIRRLGGKRWQRLHRLVYLSAVAASLHYLWLVKRDVREPLVFLGILGALLGWRVWARAAGAR
ncbi:MAG TPA: protein-methionine-sulfoxide reductase heme-binding subunit MsrQ [Gemmatimonadales bacterium]|nr:protein-methionine-sulfoxide reductase heme-binding subunit MsrQ [Gemmatimonadales bacterium]